MLGPNDYKKLNHLHYLCISSKTCSFLLSGSRCVFVCDEYIDGQTYMLHPWLQSEAFGTRASRQVFQDVLTGHRLPRTTLSTRQEEKQSEGILRCASQFKKTVWIFKIQVNVLLSALFSLPGGDLTVDQGTLHIV